ncbi:MAG: hypothetical protein JWQ17_1190 [Tardiphaga sp.]|nr:hypothetical protein [Tardiphaga sp.]
MTTWAVTTRCGSDDCVPPFEIGECRGLRAIEPDRDADEDPQGTIDRTVTNFVCNRITEFGQCGTKLVTQVTESIPEANAASP